MEESTIFFFFISLKLWDPQISRRQVFNIDILEWVSEGKLLPAVIFSYLEIQETFGEKTQDSKKDMLESPCKVLI